MTVLVFIYKLILYYDLKHIHLNQLSFQSVYGQPYMYTMTENCTKSEVQDDCFTQIYPVLHHCVVNFFLSSGIMECTCMLFTFENGVLLMR